MLTSSLTPIVSAFVDKSLAAAPRKATRSDVVNWLDMLSSDISSGLACLARSLYICSLIGPYVNENTTIADEVNASFAAMRGTRNSMFYRMLSYIPIGYSFCEKIYDTKTTGSARLAMVNLLDPAKYDFEGTLPDGIVHAKYSGADGDILVPYEDGIHLRAEEHLLYDNSPYGIAACKRAFPYWELHKITLAAMAIAIQRQATPLLVGKTDAGAESVLVDDKGSPLIDPATGRAITVKQVDSMKDMMLTLENSSVAVIDRLDEIIAISQQTGGEFFQNTLYHCATKRLEAFLVPPTLYGTSNSGVGDSNLAASHEATFRFLCRADAEYLAEAVTEDIIKPMVIFNNGEQEDYGRFAIKQEEDPQSIELLKAISDAVQKGAFDAGDQAVILKLKQLAAIE